MRSARYSEACALTDEVSAQQLFKERQHIGCKYHIAAVMRLMAEVASTKLLLSTTRPGPFIAGSSHAILTLGQRPIIGGVPLEASWLAVSVCIASVSSGLSEVPVDDGGCVTPVYACTRMAPFLAYDEKKKGFCRVAD